MAFNETQTRSIAILYDHNGNPIDSTQEGSERLLRAKATIRGGVKGTTPAADITSTHINDNHQGVDVRNWGGGHEGSQQVEGLSPNGSAPVGNPVWVGGYDGINVKPLNTVPGSGRLKATLYSLENEPIAFSSVPSDPTSICNNYVRNNGNNSLLVNGSVIPVVFSYVAHPTYNISLQQITLLIVDNSITFGSDRFGTIVGPLPQGLLIEIISQGHTGIMANIQQNEEFIDFAGADRYNWTVSSKDVLSASVLIGGSQKLLAGTSDMVRVTVRDNLSVAGSRFTCFVKGNLLPI